MIEVANEGPVAVVTMAHGKANALDTDFCEALAACFEALRGASAEAVVLTARGGIFCAGVDLPRAREGGPDYLRGFLPALGRLYETIFFHPKPVVAAINGHAVAGGCVLACAADRRLMAQGPGCIGVTELLVGLPFPALAFEIMRFVVAPARFPEVVLSGATFPPKEAVSRGLIDGIVAPEALAGEALAAARKLAGLRPAAFELTKRQIRQPVLDKFRRDGAGIDAAVTEIWCAPEASASIAAYVARTLKRR